MADDGAATARERILDAAETLFAERGYDGVSIRAVVLLAEVDVALPHYHFGSKEALLRAVIRRRAQQQCEDLIAALDAAFVAAAPRVPSLETILRSLLQPIAVKLRSGHAGWQNYVRLMATLQSVPQQQGYLAEMQHHYLPLQQRFIAAARQAMPAMSDRALYWSWYFFDAAVVHILTDTHSIDQLSDGVCSTGRFDDIVQLLPAFCAAGWQRLGSLQDSEPLLTDPVRMAG